MNKTVHSTKAIKTTKTTNLKAKNATKKVEEKAETSFNLKDFIKQNLYKYYYGLLKKQLDVVNVDLEWTLSNMSDDFTIIWKIYKAKNPKNYRTFSILNEGGQLTITVQDFEKKECIKKKVIEDNCKNLLPILNEKMYYLIFPKISKTEMNKLRELCAKSIRN